MNIFALDSDPEKAAKYHVDKHTVKMILEYSQLLSTAHRVIDGKEINVLSKTGRKVTRQVLPDNRESILYTATHVNHPSAIWVRESRENYLWCLELLKEVCKEYTYRYGRVHKSEGSGVVRELCSVPSGIKSSALTPVRLAMPDEYKVAGDHVASYRKYYKEGKQHLHNWRNRPVPEWLIS